MVRVLVVLRGGYPWGFRMQGGGDKPLIVSKVTSTGKAGGAGVRAGCAVKAINGTLTAQLSLSHAHAPTKQGSTLTLEIDDTSEEPRGATLSSNTSICSSNSTSTSSTVVAANGHISSSRRRTESGGSEERARDTRSDHHSSDRDKSALQELGLDESTLLSEIEQILGFGSLTKNRTEKPANTTTAAASSSRPESFEKPVKSTKPNRRKSEGEKPVVPERDSSKGVWSPGRGDDASTASGPSRIELPDLPSFKDQPTVWSPVRAGSASPSLGRKEYRKVTYDGTSTLQRRPSQENVSVPKPEESFAWKDINVEKVARSPTSSLPKVQNPTVTLLQKKREGQIPGKRPEYLKPDDIGPKYKPDDKLYVIKREYESEDEEGGRRFAVLGPKKVQGVGPTTTEGVPTTLKSGVKSEHQGEWYRRMFDSLHKVKDARYGGYLSEPEGYDSDIGSSRYATLDRRRQHHFEVDPMTSSLPRNTNRYVHQPGRIEDYIPGYSSLSEKELKKNPEADVKLESQSQEPPPVSVNHRYGSQKMSMTHALKESGYESDSTLVFRKREDARRQAPDPRKTSQVYRQNLRTSMSLEK
ncbi:hypothetical protein OTU49_017396 [Cherax quadricarinatus]|uniref:SoHo domain-containing protein n=1 Tax=Cherax quadricarinatus TaxID=27406 RepID=A0AAW0XG14_CHEQU